MSQKGNVQLMMVIVAPPGAGCGGRAYSRITRRGWSQRYHRGGDKALLSYSVSKAPELSNPMDPGSTQTGNVCYVLTEVYETNASVMNLFQ